MKIALGCDHGGYALKQHVIQVLERLGHTCEDFGCFSTESCDYPDFGAAAARAVAEGSCERGIVICTTGIGASITANKVKGVRCALCSEPWSAQMTRRHNDANVLVLPARFITNDQALEFLDEFIATPFEGDRHVARIAKMPLAAWEEARKTTK